MGSLLAKADVFPYSPIVRLNQTEKVKSKFSGFCSIILLFAILTLVVFKLQEVFSHTITSYQVADLVSFDPKKKV